jgi:hypothetical protein
VQKIRQHDDRRAFADDLEMVRQQEPAAAVAAQDYRGAAAVLHSTHHALKKKPRLSDEKIMDHPTSSACNFLKNVF